MVVLSSKPSTPDGRGGPSSEFLDSQAIQRNPALKQNKTETKSKA